MKIKAVATPRNVQTSCFRFDSFSFVIQRNLFKVVLPAWCLAKAAIGKYVQSKQVFFSVISIYITVLQFI